MVDPLLEVLQQSTRAMEALVFRQEAVEKSSDEAKGILARLDRTVTRYADAREREATALVAEVELRRLEIMGRKELYGQRWSRISEITKNVLTTARSAASHPAVSAVIGVVLYGTAKLLAGWLGVPLPEAMP